MEKGRTEISLHPIGRDASSHTRLQYDRASNRPLNDQTGTETEINGQSNCNRGECTNET